MMLERGEHYAILDDLKQEGKIQHYGVSVHDAYEGVMAIETGKPGVIQVGYNLLRQEPRDELFAVVQEQDIGLIAREPLANGILTGKYAADTTFSAVDMRAQWPPEYLAFQVQLVEKLRFLAIDEQRTLAQAALRFVMNEDAVSVVIPGMKTMAQVEENIAAADLLALSIRECDAVRDIVENAMDDLL